MDRVRPEQKKRRRTRQLVYGAIGLLVAVIITAALARPKPAAPTVELS